MTSEEVQSLLDQGWPLYLIEEYADLLENQKAEVSNAFRAFSLIPLDAATQKPH